MREVYFYVILLNYARLIKESSKKSIGTVIGNEKCDVVMGHGKVNDDEDCELTSCNNVSDETIGEKHT